MSRKKMKEIIKDAVNRGIFKKIVFSQPQSRSVKRAQATLFRSKKGLFIQFETFMADGKALHVNYAPDAAAEYADELMENEFRRANVITTAGECQVMVSKKGKTTVLNRIKDSATPPAEIGSHDEKHPYVIPEGKPCDFLRLLGVCDEEGRVFDRKRTKFRQINRFLEIVRDVFPRKTEEDLYVLDLCCGKSYLSFALYHYLHEILGCDVKMTGVDLKADVIEYCSGVAKECGFDGLEFVCGDIADVVPERTPDLVVSLHACDTATDIVLAKAIESSARVILSSPCCQHEMARQLPHDDADLGFILSKPLFRERFAVLATDALRALRLEADGYAVDAIEFIDPEETPKNLMIRAQKKREKNEAAAQSYDAACRRFGISPKLAKLLDGE